ncbi:uncharacterized protein [Leptinotarsa decemlineata]|uniref:uncharacterized protein n=1 Tax=Leptinotarsa decemlineata TaxID=7539 RepID=UPI000C254499|nr:uncharacterized protein LOC111515074 [Leptinotarsa decemlineata]
MSNSGKPCPVADECSMMKSMATTANSTMPSTPSSLPSSLPSSFFENQFYDSLISFMQECSRVMDEVHRRSGKREIHMTQEEKQAKIQELMNKIAEKERELSQLEEEKRNMLSNYDASASSAGSGPAFTPPVKHARQPRGTSRRMPRSPYQHSQDGTSCIPGCDADCSFSVPAETNYQMHPWRQRRIMSTPERRSARPPAFDTSGYNTSNGPGGCDPNCTDPCNVLDDSTMAHWHRRLM